MEFSDDLLKQIVAGARDWELSAKRDTIPVRLPATRLRATVYKYLLWLLAEAADFYTKSANPSTASGPPTPPGREPKRAGKDDTPFLQ